MSMPVSHDREYLRMVEHVLDNGVYKSNRTGVDTKSVFGYQMRFDLSDGTIPLLTTKKMHTKSVIHEILWYLQGTGNIKYLHDNGVTIWDEWADRHGLLGPVYGVQWRNWWADGKTIDQIAQLIHTLKTDPHSRRLLITAWNPGELHLMKLPPCHYSFVCYAKPLNFNQRIELFTNGSKDSDIYREPKDVQLEWLESTHIPKHELSLKVNQRSCDVGLGVPFNIVQYSILLRMLCEVVGMAPGDLVWSGDDVHIYANHIQQLHQQCFLDPFPSPTLMFKRLVTDIDDFKFEDFVIEGYKSHPTIKMEVAV